MLLPVFTDVHTAPRSCNLGGACRVLLSGVSQQGLSLSLAVKPAHIVNECVLTSSKVPSFQSMNILAPMRHACHRRLFLKLHSPPIISGLSTPEYVLRATLLLLPPPAALVQVPLAQLWLCKIIPPQDHQWNQTHLATLDNQTPLDPAVESHSMVSSF